MRPSQPRVAFDVPESSRFQFSVRFFVGLFGVKLTRKEVSAMIDFFQGCEQNWEWAEVTLGGGLFPVLYCYSQNDSVLKRMFLHLCAMQSCVSEIQMTACIYTLERFDLYLRIGERFTSETGQIVNAFRHLHHEHSAHSFDGYRL